MGCSASVDGGSPAWISRKQCCSKMDEVSSPEKTLATVTPRNWMSLTHNLQQAQRKRKQLDDRKLFIDAQFPPRDVSIGARQGKHNQKKIVWKRPHELSLHPVLFMEGGSKHDLKQGDLNNSWFLSTLALIADKPQLIDKVMPLDMSFGSSNYNGSFQCRFWQFGHWEDVVVDDLLPTVDGNLLFARSSNPTEYWVSLVEKAYAKLNKSYAALETGFEADAFTDLTGGLAELYNPRELRDNDFYMMRAAFHCGAVLSCVSANRNSIDSSSGQGMVNGHSYVVTGVEEVPYRDTAVKLIKVHNPWGSTNWEGEWCDGADEWKRVPENIKRELDVTSLEKGEFWMSFNDFKRYYSHLIICNVLPNFDHDGISDKAEFQLHLLGRWETDVNAGGWLECHESFHLNPQYSLTVRHDAHMQRRYNGRLPVVISLLQIYRKGIPRPQEDDDLYAIGFELFQLPSRPKRPMGSDFFQDMDPLMPENEETYVKYRETSGRFFLTPGEYLLVPSTHEPRLTRDYLLRLFSVSKIDCVSVGNVLSPLSACS